MLDPKFALPHNNLGYLLADQRKPDEAAAEYKKAIELDPKYALPHNNPRLPSRATSASPTRPPPNS